MFVPAFLDRTVGLLPFRAAALAIGWFMAGPSTAQTTDAGSTVSNTATLRWEVEGVPYAVRSNTDVLAVAERLDLTLALSGPIGRERVAALILTNTGNGREAFALSAAVSGSTGTVPLALDMDRDGRFDPALDRKLEGVTPVLAPRESAALLVVAGSSAEVVVTAQAATGSGAPGQVVPGGGDGGTDAVVGSTGASARLVLPFPEAAIPTLVKSQSVTDPAGGSRAGRGSIITYTLAASFPAGTPAAVLSDSIPNGTRYRERSMTLDGVVLSEAADADPGGFDGNAISVALPAATIAAAHTVQFQVVIP